MIRHHPWLVRINMDDLTLHCEVHGLLTAVEAADVTERANVSRMLAAAAWEQGSTWRRVLAYALDAFYRRFRQPRCET